MRLFWALVAALFAVGAFIAFAGEVGQGTSQARALDESGSDANAPETSGREVSTRETSAPGALPAGSLATPSAPHAEVRPPASAAVPPSDVAAPPVSEPTPDFDLLGEGGTRVAPLLVDARSPLEVTRRIDARTVELDGRYRIVGNGSADDPYRISWELLTSASQYVDPAREALVPPPWVRAIDGTYVEISAYYSSAIRVQFARHLLLTLNRWDGCCIGLPPTPFDAIDVTMREPVPMGGLHLVRFGTFRGRLVVEPLQAAGFLLGLYRLEDATFEAK